MNKLSTKKLIVAGMLAGVMTISGAPLSANALSNNHSNNNSHHQQDNDRRDRDRRHHHNREITQRKALRIAQRVFPHKRIVDIDMRRDHGVREYQVKFKGGNRVDVRVRDGRVTYVHVHHHWHAWQH